MGLLIDGQWHDRWYENTERGEFKREAAKYRGWLTPTGGPGPQGQEGFVAEPDRYHLYVSLACPWAHRTLIFRELKGLQSLIGVSVVGWLMGENGWTFDKRFGSTGDALGDTKFLYQRYLQDDPQQSGRVTVPVLWDRREQRIVCNESADIIRMLNQAFDHLTGNRLDLCPNELLESIDDLNRRIYPAVNNGVYRAGFATTQTAYEEAYDALFAELDRLEELLGTRRYLTGQWLTEADWRLFTSLVRFDAVYYSHFKCNRQRIADFPNLSNWLRELYQWPGVASTVRLDHIKGHYYGSHRQINANGLIPKGPELALDRPHDRARLPGHGIHQRPLS